MKDNKRVVPKKNYLYLLIMLLIVVFVTFGVVNISNYYDEKKLEKSYFDGYISEVTLKDMKNILTEPSSEMFIIITEVNNEEIYRQEKEIKKVIKKRDIRDNIMFIDYTDNKNDLSELNKVLGSNIKSIPAIIYYKNGQIVTSIDSSNGLLNAFEFEKLLDSYEVE